MTHLAPNTDLKRRLQRFNGIVIEAAKKHVGKTKPRRGGKSFITPEIKEAIKRRNSLRQNVQNNREAWIEACKEVQEKMQTAREESWKDLLSSATNESEGKIWSVIRTLRGSPDSNSPNEAMIHNNHLKPEEGQHFRQPLCQGQQTPVHQRGKRPK